MKADVIASIQTLRDRLSSSRVSGTTVGLVPTMGALHQGHARLIEQARRECGIVVVSVFVNPLQFDRQDDLDRYPRTLDADVELCSSLGADLVFAPTVADMYPQPPMCVVEVGTMADHLCGRHRPGHFRGMATVVLKLLQIVEPGRAYFGEKDAQQLAIIRRMVLDLNVPSAIVGVPTVREPDGLAMSSRNRHLSPGERQSATLLYRALLEAERQTLAGATDPNAIVSEAIRQMPPESGLKVEYVEVVDPDDLQPVERVTGPVLVAGAVWAGATRLIDNILCRPKKVGLTPA